MPVVRCGAAGAAATGAAAGARAGVAAAPSCCCTAVATGACVSVGADCGFVPAGCVAQADSGNNDMHASSTPAYEVAEGQAEARVDIIYSIF
jgi:hypothetical protein